MGATLDTETLKRTPDPSPGRFARWKRPLWWLFALGSVALLVAVVDSVQLWDTVRLDDGTTLTGRIVEIERAPADPAAADPDAAGEITRLHIEIEGDDGATHTREVTAAELADPLEGADGEPAPLAIRRGFVPLLLLLSVEVIVAFAALYFFTIAVTAVRWTILARSAGIPLKVWDAFRLHLVGMYYMHTLPAGLAAGDVIKALYLRRQTGRVTDAMVSVFADRVLGLATMVLIALAAIAMWGRDERFVTLGLLLGGMLLLYAIATGAMLSRRLRKRLRLAGLIQRLPFHGLFDELQRTVRQYRGASRSILAAMGVSACSQVSLILLNALYGDALGIPDLTLADYCFIVPVVYIITAIPGLPGGWGIGEGAYVGLFAIYNVPAEYALALSVLVRSSWMVLSFSGLLFALSFRQSLAPADGGVAERREPADVASENTGDASAAPESASNPEEIQDSPLAQSAAHDAASDRDAPSAESAPIGGP